MKRSKSSGMFKPFENLKSLLEKRSFPLAPVHTNHSTHHKDSTPDSVTEKQQFLEAMTGVRPISRDKCIKQKPQMAHSKNNVFENDCSPELLTHLRNLVRYGQGFFVADTPEYVEGTGYQVHPTITARLHRGDFSIQAYVDLHGLNVKEAKDVFERFLQANIHAGRRGILVVHGRGLSSPSDPVLKGKVLEWLTRGQWRKWILAFSSARLCDGGAGAVYVLLRKRPLTKSRINRLNKTSPEKYQKSEKLSGQPEQQHPHKNRTP